MRWAACHWARRWACTAVGTLTSGRAGRGVGGGSRRTRVWASVAASRVGRGADRDATVRTSGAQLFERSAQNSEYAHFPCAFSRGLSLRAPPQFVKYARRRRESIRRARDSPACAKVLETAQISAPDPQRSCAPRPRGGAKHWDPASKVSRPRLERSSRRFCSWRTQRVHRACLPCAVGGSRRAAAAKPAVRSATPRAARHWSRLTPWLGSPPVLTRFGHATAARPHVRAARASLLCKHLVRLGVVGGGTGLTGPHLPHRSATYTWHRPNAQCRIRAAAHAYNLRPYAPSELIFPPRLPPARGPKSRLLRS